VVSAAVPCGRNVFEVKIRIQLEKELNTFTTAIQEAA
jgi:hypothetical protein